MFAVPGGVDKVDKVGGGTPNRETVPGRDGGPKPDESAGEAAGRLGVPGERGYIGSVVAEAVGGPNVEAAAGEGAGRAGPALDGEAREGEGEVVRVAGGEAGCPGFDSPAATSGVSDARELRAALFADGTDGVGEAVALASFAVGLWTTPMLGPGGNPSGFVADGFGLGTGDGGRSSPRFAIAREFSPNGAGIPGREGGPAVEGKGRGGWAPNNETPGIDNDGPEAVGESSLGEACAVPSVTSGEACRIEDD
jgi:hypothetical protein